MCTDGDQLPGTVAGALRMTHAGLDYLNSPAATELHAAAVGDVLTSLGELQAAACSSAAAGELR